MWKFYDWLPARSHTESRGATVTYRSDSLSRELDIDLYVAFNGYWPERGAEMLTCSFKELEAPPTIVRAREHGGKAMVLASAGNTGRAFAYLSTVTGFPLIVVVPERNVERLWIPGREPGPSVRLIAVRDADYSDAIALADRIAALPGIMPEGGAKNVARRDGMGTVMLDAAVAMKAMPDDYFQAIGSGTGGIAAWEAALRLRDDGRFGAGLPRLHLAQNRPFVPMLHAWEAGRRDIRPDMDMPDAKRAIAEMYSDVLSNRSPPYSIRGGVYDALKDTGGIVYGVTRAEAERAKRLFEEREGIDILPPAAVAVAALLQACERGILEGRRVLLNITGGGQERLEKEMPVYRIEPAQEVPGPDAPVEQIMEVLL
ncbi:MAG: Cysteate synthase [Methanocella sp. PtaU1.Bin125]|nr:MAG: Cysteate synthase [Methanocella sp. PtaU1.Bin125]